LRNTVPATTDRGDEKELVWIDVREDFFDMSRFAGEGNIGHIFEIINQNQSKTNANQGDSTP
jgi:8-oxo-dGTP diphosphatase